MLYITYFKYAICYKSYSELFKNISEIVSSSKLETSEKIKFE